MDEQRMNKPGLDVMTYLKFLSALWLVLAAGASLADDASIRKNLAERIPQLKQIDEISKTAIPGLFEVRVNGIEIFYTDGEANYLIQGNLIDTKQKRNLTEERIDKLTAVAFDSLPTKDAFTIVRGNGKRRLAVFEDPNCGYCKQFERELQKVDNITISMYLFPVLGPNSMEKSRGIWCAKDKGKTWLDFMVRDQPVPPAAASCDTTALARNLELGKKYRITGTPTLVFTDGSRVPGAIGAAQVEKYLADIKN
jgi:thiol:disulfide interchange protein DsbC